MRQPVLHSAVGIWGTVLVLVGMLLLPAYGQQTVSTSGGSAVVRQQLREVGRVGSVAETLRSVATVSPELTTDTPASLADVPPVEDAQPANQPEVSPKELQQLINAAGENAGGAAQGGPTVVSNEPPSSQQSAQQPVPPQPGASPEAGTSGQGTAPSGQQPAPAVEPPAPREQAVPVEAVVESNASLATRIRRLMQELSTGEGGGNTLKASGKEQTKTETPVPSEASPTPAPATPPSPAPTPPESQPSSTPTAQPGEQAAEPSKVPMTPDMPPISPMEPGGPVADKAPNAIQKRATVEAKKEVAPETIPVTGDPLDQIVNIDFRNLDLTNVVAMLAQKAGINVIAGTALKGTVTANLRNVTLRQAMETALRMNGLGLVEEEGIFRIVPYDEAMELNIRTEMVQLDNAAAADVQNILQDVISVGRDNKIITITSNKSTNTVVIRAPKNRIQDLVNLAKQLDVAKPVMPTVTEAIPLNYADPAEVVQMLTKMLTPSIGQAAADKRARHIVVTDMPVVVEQIKQVVKSLDIPVRQVMIETMVVDALLNDEADTGAKWLMNAVKRQSRRDVALYGEENAPNIGTLQALGLATDMEVLRTAAGLLNFSVLTDDIDWQGVIQLEVRNRNGRLVSNPVVMAVENQPATISIAQEIPYQELRQTNLGGSQTTTQFKEVGTVLTVTPKVTHDNSIICEVQAKESTTSGQFQGVPIEDKREVKSTMHLNNGQTVFIGGLRKSDSNSTVRKVPVVGDIPVMGTLFKANQRKETINELMVFLTCNVIENAPPLTERQKQIKEKATIPDNPKVDAWETVKYDIMHPNATKEQQFTLRRGE
ncbi:MAG TPA: secretin N-terminal domain-containing protein [Candidatus Hydrogenedentes bacterium]|nr:secretin N-terminal domain-containing protein [Candidatus Hydrogenedentota bacterium]